MILFYDCETTGLVEWNKPSDHESQPHIVQLAAILVDPITRQERAAVDLIVRPEGWVIPDEVAAIHGITNEIAARSGINEITATDLFCGLRERASFEVAHNISFDRRIMRIAMLRRGVSREEVEHRESVPTVCTMKSSTAIVNLPPTPKMLAAGFAKPKPPKLSECVKHFFGEDLAGAHNALNDVRACARVYWHIQDLKAA